ncbi:hypothetical protein BDY19DRAFT_998029 [Irpex rosettiformis]|uniref:Uncharacterized protein n=1 Tax=Irpex rosettiformis TaxID=378272 RepID=A0ACB8TPT5_9APHY|nr:hypothetical protein BDY19DRAFT_998029 [Irpex rosettiformis]
MSTDTTHLLHAGLILLGAWCCRMTFTSPNSTPNQKEQKMYEEYKAVDPLFLPTKLSGGMAQGFYYVLNAVELANASGIELPFKYLPAFLRPSRDMYISSPERTIGLAFIVAGTALRILCYRYMQKNFTIELAIRENHKLVTDGPYAYVRHPAYTAGVTVIVGCLMFNLGRGSWWAEYALSNHSPWLVIGVLQVIWGAVLLYVAVTRCSVEDDALREHFKEDWVRWAKKTPYRMVPSLF